MKHVFALLLTSIVFFIGSQKVAAQTILPLYNSPIPNSKEVPDTEKWEYREDSILTISNITRPTLTVFLPKKEKATGAAVVICPGGGYWITASKHEGTDVAKRFNEMGVAAFVLKYRIPSDNSMINKEIGPLQDAQRAIQLVRENRKKWGIKKDKIGIMGFSAGGHLASTAGTHFQKSYIDNPKKISLRPDFMALIYPVISFMPKITHAGSARQLLGENPTPEKLKGYSNEFQVTRETPPTFLVHAKNDEVKVENTLVFENALLEHNVPVEKYLYEEGGHGYGMVNKTSSVLWMDLVEKWMKTRGFIK
ncbi:MAG TPA: alpha/beta hydrolase [Pedobacter sp.]|jgi:acetyl esterase/lipase